MPLFDDHQVPPEPPPDNDPLPDKDPSPDEEPVPDHHPVAEDGEKNKCSLQDQANQILIKRRIFAASTSRQ